MGRCRIGLMVMLMWATVNDSGAAQGELVNGSFEADGPIGDVRVLPPSGWDVNLPAGKFTGSVTSAWPTDGNDALTLSANWMKTFSAGDMGTVAQEILLDDIDRITFDLRLTASGSATWDQTLCTAVALLDNEVVWDSGSVSADSKGEYRDQAVAVDDKYRDGRLHRLAFGLRMNTDGISWVMYTSDWDAVECVARVCAELLPGDFNRDCFVNVDDLMLLAGQWLVAVPLESPYNLCTTPAENAAGAGMVNGFDFAVLSNYWLAGGAGQEPY
jgi:hypothetical protein